MGKYSQGEVMNISSRIGSKSLCGVSGEFPYKRGNYCSNVDGFYFVNLWAENIEYMVWNGMINHEVRARVFYKDGRKYALVEDSRISDDVYHEPYFCGIKTNTDIIRFYNKIPDEQCICDFGHIGWSSWIDSVKSGKCHECGTSFKERYIPHGIYTIWHYMDESLYTRRQMMVEWDGKHFRTFGKAEPIPPHRIACVIDERVSMKYDKDKEMSYDEFVYEGPIE